MAWISSSSPLSVNTVVVKAHALLSFETDEQNSSSSFLRGVVAEVGSTPLEGEERLARLCVFKSVFLANMLRAIFFSDKVATGLPC